MLNGEEACRNKTIFLKKDATTILNFSFVHFLESSDRLSSPKLPDKSSSPLPPPSSSLPAASSKPSVHDVINMNKSTLSARETISQKTIDETNNLADQQQSSSTQINLDENTKQSKPKTQQNSVLSNESKQRAQILLEKLTQTIDFHLKQSNINHTRSQEPYIDLQHHKDDQIYSQRSTISSSDLFTNKLPPKSQRRSSALNENDNKITDDTS